MTYTDNPWLPLFITVQNMIVGEQLPEPNAEHFFEKSIKAIDSAKQEITFGNTINDLISTPETSIETEQMTLATIGVWHYECSIELFNKAIRNFEKAKNLGLKRDVEKQILECKKQIKAIAARKDSAEEFLKKSVQD